jgi:hypothetical protein
MTTFAFPAAVVVAGAVEKGCESFAVSCGRVIARA